MERGEIAPGASSLIHNILLPDVRFSVKRRTRFSLRDKRLIEIIEVEMYFYHLTVLLQYCHRLTTISKNFTLTFDS